MESDDIDDVVMALAALAQASRLQAFRALVVAGPAGLTPGAMAESLGMPAATLSFHLKELLRAGLVTQQRDGRRLIYRAAYPRMNALIGFLTDHCCQGQPCGTPTAPACDC
jgi:DNA-binding transcriptional ArsR family regulator